MSGGEGGLATCMEKEDLRNLGWEVEEKITLGEFVIKVQVWCCHANVKLG